VILWKVNSTKPVLTISDHNGLITCIKFNELFIAGGSRDHTARVWDCTTGVNVNTIQHNGSVTSLGFDENTIYTSSERIGKICDLRKEI